MSFDFPAFIHLIFIGFIALFPVINPLGSSFIVSPYFSHLNRQERMNAVKRITFYAFSICLVTLIIGHWILQLFGITIPIIQLAGGILICKTGWELLSPPPQSPVDEVADHDKNFSHELESKLFFPITFPITTGAGTISVLFTLSANGASKNISQYLINSSAIMISVSALCILVFICYLNANRLIKYLGSHREKIINSIMAFLFFASAYRSLLKESPN